MAIPLTLFHIAFSATLVSGHIQTPIETTRGTRTAEPWEERGTLPGEEDRKQRSVGSVAGDQDCQEVDPEGNLLGGSYSGTVSHTVSGRTCQNWSAKEPHVPGFTDVGRVGETEPGDHNFCRTAGLSGGVWCYTTDPDKRWEFCSVPICGGEIKSPRLLS